MKAKNIDILPVKNRDELMITLELENGSVETFKFSNEKYEDAYALYYRLLEQYNYIAPPKKSHWKDKEERHRTWQRKEAYVLKNELDKEDGL